MNVAENFIFYTSTIVILTKINFIEKWKFLNDRVQFTYILLQWIYRIFSEHNKKISDNIMCTDSSIWSIFTCQNRIEWCV